LVALSGCGGGSKGKPIPSDQADRMNRAIQAADQYSADGRCTRAHTKVRDAKFLLSQVPTSVDSDVRQGISDGLDHLDSLISSECQTPQNTQTDTTPTNTDTTPTDTQTQTTETQTTPTETTPPTQTTLTQTTPTDTTPTTTGTTPTTTNGGTPPGAGADGQG
jgi:hypothetical protein